MPSKEQTIESLVKSTYAKSEVLHLISHINCIEENKPSVIKRGDVVKLSCGAKKRPVVVIKVTKDIIVGIPLSTTKDCLFLIEGSSRFFGDSHFSNQLITAPMDVAIENWIGVYDNPAALNQAVKKLREFISKVL